MSEFNRAVRAYTTLSGVSQGQPLIVSGQGLGGCVVTVSQVIDAMSAQANKDKTRLLRLLQLTNHRDADVLNFFSQCAELLSQQIPENSES